MPIDSCSREGTAALNFMTIKSSTVNLKRWVRAVWKASISGVATSIYPLYMRALALGVFRTHSAAFALEMTVDVLERHRRRRSFLAVAFHY